MIKHASVISVGICCSLLSGCVGSSAVDDFAMASTQAASLFPAVAAIPYDVCVADQQNQQLAAVTDFDVKFEFDQSKIDSNCKAAEATSQRLQKTYTVLATYISALGKLAGGNVPTYDTNITTLVATTPGLTLSQQTAVSGLASLVADMIDKGYRQKEAAKAIEKAQPWVQQLTGMLKDQLPALLNQYLSNEIDSRGSLYRGIYVFRFKGTELHTSAVLVTKDFMEDRTQIENARNAVAAFEKIFVSIGEGHTILYNNRNKLWDKNVLQQVFQSASSIEKQVTAVDGDACRAPVATGAKEK